MALLEGWGRKGGKCVGWFYKIPDFNQPRTEPELLTASRPMAVSQCDFSPYL